VQEPDRLEEFHLWRNALGFKLILANLQGNKDTDPGFDQIHDFAIARLVVPETNEQCFFNATCDAFSVKIFAVF
jgi:hypothetical protein